MTENTPTVLLDVVTEMESATFRAGQVARRLVAEHPQLTVRTATVALYASVYNDGERHCRPRLELRAENVDDAHSWAEALGAEPETSTKEVGGWVYESAHCTATVDGVQIEVSGSRTLTADEAAAWRAAGDQGEDGDS